MCKDTQCAFWGKGNVISGGEPSALLHKEASSFLSREEKMALIKEAGIVDIGPGEVCSLRLLFLYAGPLKIHDVYMNELTCNF